VGIDRVNSQLLAKQGSTVVVSVEPRDCFGNAATLAADQAVQVELVKHGSAASRQQFVHSTQTLDAEDGVPLVLQVRAWFRATGSLSFFTPSPTRPACLLVPPSSTMQMELVRMGMGG
jgi:hypothetical protein